MEKPKFEQKSPEGETKKEQILTPEMEEAIMEKIQDIDAKGTAYTSIALGFDLGGKDWKIKIKDFEKILQEGLLGSPYSSLNEDFGFPVTKKSWKKNVKNRKFPNPEHDAVVYFNIVGRSLPDIDIPRRNDKTLISQTEYTRYPDAISIIFDTSSFKEEEVIRAHGAIGSKKFYATGGRRNEEGKRMPTLEYGFVLSYRVAPRFFQGIVVGFSDKVEDVVSAMLKQYEHKPHLLLPIYDIQGNLLWPKPMRYEQVKKFIEERDQKNKEARDLVK